MTTFGEFPTTFIPRSVSDSIDGDNSEAGACSALTNVIFDPSTPGVLQCRPAVKQLNVFTGFDNPNIVSDAIQVNGIIYGLIGSDHFPGKDEPFAFDISSGSFLTISGVTSDNCPNTLNAAGDWIPPDISSLGTRIVLTHSGFNFGAGQAFGYFDISNFDQVVTGNISSGSPTITGFPIIDGIGPGYALSGTGIPADTVVADVSNFASNGVLGNTNTSMSITNVSDTTGLAIGQSVVGSGIPTGAVITGISGNTVTISISATSTATNVPIFFTGTTITMSNNATATTSSLSITVQGGTDSNPLWAVGNLMINPLPALPTTVGNYNNRFYFGVGNAASWTDTLSLSASSATQALFIGDSTPITAMTALQMSTTTQALIQAFIIFKADYIAQLTGDAILNNLDVAAVSEEAIGTVSPRSLGVTPNGIYFRAVDGIRLIQLSGILTDPDPDLALPFIYALYPSRISAGFNNNTYRICVQNGNALGAPFQEYWYDLKRKGWTGPHTFRQDLALPYNSTFILFSNTFSPSIWQSDVVVNNSDSFVEVGATDYVAEDGVTDYVAEDGVSQYLSEDTGVVTYYVAEDGTTMYVTEDGLQDYIAENITGFPMEFLYQTVPMTDFGNAYANTLMNSTLDIAMPSNGIAYVFTALNEIYASIATASLLAPPATAIWGQFLWNLANWGTIAFGLQPRTIPWPIPIVFNRLSLSVSGNSSSGLKLGSFHIIAKTLKYLLH